jgi:hypothetical protein
MSNSDITPNLLVTGASGTVSHELVKQLLASSPLTNQNVIAGVHKKRCRKIEQIFRVENS